MAKKIAAIDPKAGISAREILAFAAGKTPEELGIDDIRSLATKQGVSPKDTSRILSGAKSFLGSGSDYRLTNDEGFNVVDPKTGPKTASSRTSGNKKGFNAGDLIGLGNNVSTLMGLAGKYKKGFENKPSVSPSSTSEPSTQTTQAGTKEETTKTAASLLGTEGKPGKKTPASALTTGPKATPERFNAELEKYRANRFKKTPYAKYVNLDQVKSQEFDENTINQKLSEYSDMIAHSLDDKIKEPAGLLKETLGPSSFNIFDREISNVNLEKLFNDYEHNLKLGYDIKPPHEDFMTKGPHLGNSEDLASNSELAGDMLTMGLGPKIIGGAAKGIAMGKSHPTYQYMKYLLSRRAPLPNMMTNANALTKASSMGTQTASQLAMSPARKLMQRGADRVKFPKVEPTTGGGAAVEDVGVHGPAIPMGSGVKPRFTVKGEGVPKPSEGVKNFKVKSFNKRPSRVPGTPDYAPAGEFADGGKIIWGTRRYGPGGLIKKPSTDYLSDYETPNFSDNPTYTASELMYPDLGKGAPGSTAKGNYQTPSVEESGSGLFGTRNPKSGIDFSGGESTGGDVAGKIAKYALPFIGEGLAREQFNKFKPTPFESVDMAKMPEADLPKPNMRLRARPEVTGSDLLSNIGGQKFADAQEQDKEVDYSIQNALQKQQTRLKNIDTTNQGAMFNAQGKRMQAIYNDQLRAQFAGAKAESVRQPFIAAQQHLATDISANTYLQTDKKAALATEVIRNRDRYTPEEVRQAEAYLSGVRIKGKKGMKFRNKFSAYAV